MRRSKRAQLSLEMIILLAVLLAGFAVVLLVSNQSLSTARNKVYHDQARLAIDQISETVERVYVEGLGSRQTVLVTFPETINGTTVSGNALTLHLLVKGGNIQDVYRSVPVNVSGSLPQTPGRHSIVIESGTTGVVLSS